MYDTCMHTFKVQFMYSSMLPVCTHVPPRCTHVHHIYIYIYDTDDNFIHINA